MTLLTSEDLERYNFQQLDDSGIFWIDGEVMVVARQEGDKIEVSRARDADGRYFDRKNNRGVFRYNDDFGRFLTGLKDRRWSGIDSTTRDMLREIASSKPGENNDDLAENALDRIKNYRGTVRARLELEFDLAMQCIYNENNRMRYLSELFNF